MLTIMFWIAVGAFVGWNMPQPVWAQNTQDSLVDFTAKLISKYK